MLKIDDGIFELGFKKSTSDVETRFLKCLKFRLGELADSRKKKLTNVVRDYNKKERTNFPEDWWIDEDEWKSKKNDWKLSGKTADFKGFIKERNYWASLEKERECEWVPDDGLFNKIVIPLECDGNAKEAFLTIVAGKNQIEDIDDFIDSYRGEK